MTILQIICLCAAGPVGLIQIMHAIRAVAKGEDFYLGQAVILFAAITVILIAFLGFS